MAKIRSGEQRIPYSNSKILSMVSKHHGNQKGGLILEGKNIKIQLMSLGKTQRWLLEQLHKHGFVSLRESTLSSILSGAYVAPLADSVLDVSGKILNGQE